MQRPNHKSRTVRCSRHAWLRSAALAWLLASCQSKRAESSMQDAGNASDAGAGCVGDPRAENYSANLEKTGTAGVFNFRLVESTPAPPAKGNNTWRMQLSDLAGNPVSGATLSVRTLMPDHGHASPVAATVTPTTDGYQVAPLYLFMSGLWQVTISAKAGAQSDSAAFTFCVAP